MINEVDNKILFSSSVELRDHFSLVYQDHNTLKIVSISQKTCQGTVEKIKRGRDQKFEHLNHQHQFK